MGPLDKRRTARDRGRIESVTIVNSAPHPCSRRGPGAVCMRVTLSVRMWPSGTLLSTFRMSFIQSCQYNHPPKIINCFDNCLPNILKKLSTFLCFQKKILGVAPTPNTPRPTVVLPPACSTPALRTLCPLYSRACGRLGLPQLPSLELQMSRHLRPCHQM